MPARLLLLATLLSPPDRHAEARACSRVSIMPTRDTSTVYFLGTALPDTVPVDSGTVRLREGSGHSARGITRLLYGQLIDVERLGRPWVSRLPSDTKRVILVPWDYDAGCEPVYWSLSARFSSAGTHGVFHATLRPQRFWTNGVPTLDVMAPPYTPYPSAEALRRRVSVLAAETDGALSPNDYLDLVEILPRADSLYLDPDRAVSPVLDWARSNPTRARAWPVPDIVRSLTFQREEARLRAIRSPVTGTFSVRVIFRPGDTAMVYARTDSQPMGSIRGRRKNDVDGGPVVGYYLLSQYGRSVEELPTTYRDQNTTYHAVSLDTVAMSADSIVLRGDVSPIPEVSHIDPRETIRALARSNVDVNEDELVRPDWYYMPGLWIVYRDGRVRFEWTARRGDQVVFTVRAERISTVTTGRTP